MATPHPRDAHEAFIFRDWELEGRTLHLRYALDDIPFTERLTFPATCGPALAELGEEVLRPWFQGLHLVAGVSYYKAACPPRLQLDTVKLRPEQGRFWSQVYRMGLGEFLHLNGLPFSRIAEFPVETDAPASPVFHSTHSLAPTALLLLGGGKDSITSAQLLRRMGVSFEFFTLGEHPVYAEVCEALGVPPPITVTRALDPTIRELNQRGYYNGHVPFSAYLSFLSHLVGLLRGHRWVIASNEASANEGNAVHEGVIINHQWSKTLDYETMFQEFAAHNLSLEVTYFSLLRGLEEAEIVRLFADIARPAHHVFTSCNRNFTQAGPTGERWCRKCPKCAFTFLLLADALGVAEATTILGGNLFENPNLLTTYRELLGLEGEKPYECVGTHEECRRAVRRLSEDRALRALPVLGRLADDLAPLPPCELSTWHQRPHALPSDIEPRLHGQLQELLP